MKIRRKKWWTKYKKKKSRMGFELRIGRPKRPLCPSQRLLRNETKDSAYQMLCGCKRWAQFTFAFGCRAKNKRSLLKQMLQTKQ